MSIIDQREYLKRYLSKDDEKPKKKQRKKKQSVTKRTMVIVDDDVDIKSLAPAAEAVELVEEELYDDAPTVAGMTDERPEEVKKLEAYRKSTKWKGLMDTEGSDMTGRDISVSGVKPNRHDSDSDLSPSGSKAAANDVSPVRSRKRHDSDSDNSPRRSKQRGQQEGKQNDSDSDLSHPRTAKRQGSKKEPRRIRSSPRSDRTRQRHDSDSDRSPPRTENRGNSNSDYPRQGSKQQSERIGKHGSDSDLSPSRGDGSDSDLSPIRSKSIGGGGRNSGGADSDLSPPRSGPDGKMKRTLSGQRAGLQDAKTLKAENEANRRRQDRLFESLAAEESGRNKTTIYRDKSGRKRDLAQEREQQKEEEVKKAKENEKFKEWGQGVAQKQNQEQLVEDAMKEMDKPLARYSNDQDLDSLLKEQEREGDPMLAMMRKKKSKQMELAGIKEKPRYKGPAPPPNRFGIPPGYRWDGVNRSNGFEKKYFARMANEKAMQEVKYKWSIEDM